MTVAEALSDFQKIPDNPKSIPENLSQIVIETPVKILHQTMRLRSDFV